MEPLIYRDIPKLIGFSGCYAVDINWDFLERHLAGWEKDYGLELVPDFQRGHVWSMDQRSAFVEYAIRGGFIQPLLFNCIDWNTGTLHHPVQCVDGLQRLTSIRMFLAGELTVFDGRRIGDFADKELMLRSHRLSVRVVVNNLPTRAKVLQWYLELNSGGTPHSLEEIHRVQQLLDQATSTPT